MANDELLARARCGRASARRRPQRARSTTRSSCAAAAAATRTSPPSSASSGDRQVTRGIAIADVDGDGDLDFAVANQWGPVVFYRNQSPRAGRSLGLRVMLPADGAAGPGGAPAMRPAVGATVIVKTPDGRRFTSFVDGGNGHTGRRSPDVHVGVGPVAADAALETTIVWRDRAGRHEQTTTLMPGWHTVMLGRVATAMTAPVRWTRDTRLSGLRRFAIAITMLNVVGYTVLGFEQPWIVPFVVLATAYGLEIRDRGGGRLGVRPSAPVPRRSARARRVPALRAHLGARRRHAGLRQRAPLGHELRERRRDRLQGAVPRPRRTILENGTRAHATS